MKITILNTSDNHPINAYLIRWVEKNQAKHEVELLRSKKELNGGDVLFLISCSEIISKVDRNKFKKTLVVHASDLPKGRGWSPYIWELINGAEKITLTLLEAEDKVDSGDIWKKTQAKIPKSALYEQINSIIFNAELDLMDFAVSNFFDVVPSRQLTDKPSFWSKRTPKDSEVDIHKSIDEQFNLIRVCDQERYPAFFYKDGQKFKLKIEMMNE